MIVTLDLAKTYGQQNADIAKKDKINKIDISVNLQSDNEDTSTSDSSKQVNYGPISIEQNYSNLFNIENAQSKINQNGWTGGMSGLFSGKITGTSPDFPMCVANVYYKTYKISINLNSAEYQELKNIKSQIPFTFNFSGNRKKSTLPENKEFELLLMYFTWTYGGVGNWSFSNIKNISSQDIREKLYSLDLRLTAEKITQGVSGYDSLGIESWDETNDFTNNSFEVTKIVDGEARTEEINILDEIFNIINNGTDDVNSAFSNISSYINPKILSWNNNGSTLKIDVMIPTFIYFFVSNNAILNWDSETYSITSVSPVDFKVTERVISKNHSFYAYDFTQANISFMLEYNTESEERSYYDGNRDYSASNSFLFTEGVINSDTHYVTVVNEETQESARLYDNYYDKTFADEVYEKYENGKLKLEITYPVSHLQTISGIDVVYSEEYGLCTNIGDEYFDENGNKIYVDADDNITTFTQIPEGTLCNIVKNGEVVYKDANGNPKYFLVQNSNLVYSGILVNELTLIESSEQPVSAFDEASWGEINAIGKLGELDKHFSVGEKKYVYMSNQPDDPYTNPVPIVILGFNHDALSNGNGNAGMTLGMETVLVDRYSMNNLNTNPMGWNDCDFRNTTVSQLLQTLPSDLQSAIKTVKKKSLIDNTSTDYQESDDTLFLLSVAEITGADYITNNNFSVGSAEGEQYEYWKTIKDGANATDRQKLNYTAGDGQGNFIPVEWGTRSILTSNSTSPSFMDIGSSGNITTGGSITNATGISYAFCVGEKDFLFNGTLQEATWEQIDYIARNGLGSRYFYVGQEKTITLSTGEEITLVILGFNHDDLSDGSGKAGITFGMKDLLSDKYDMYNSSYNPYVNTVGWKGSDFRQTDIPNILDEFPVELQNVLKEVNKTTLISNATYDIASIQDVTKDKLFLLSGDEIRGDVSSGTNGLEGTQYEYFTLDSTTLVKNINGEPSGWWLRSVVSNTAPTENYKRVSNLGSYGGSSVSYGFLGISLCFCV